MIPQEFLIIWGQWSHFTVCRCCWSPSLRDACCRLCHVAKVMLCVACRCCMLLAAGHACLITHLCLAAGTAQRCFALYCGLATHVAFVNSLATIRPLVQHANRDSPFGSQHLLHKLTVLVCSKSSRLYILIGV